MEIDRKKLASEIKSLIEEKMGKDVESFDEDLIENEKIDSFISFVLIEHVESQLDLSLNFEDVEADKFRTINTFVDFITNAVNS